MKRKDQKLHWMSMKPRSDSDIWNRIAIIMGILHLFPYSTSDIKMFISVHFYQKFCINSFYSGVCYREKKSPLTFSCNYGFSNPLANTDLALMAVFLILNVWIHTFALIWLPSTHCISSLIWANFSISFFSANGFSNSSNIQWFYLANIMRNVTFFPSNSVHFSISAESFQVTFNQKRLHIL